MNNNNNYAVIMAGGIGSRFWPMSTTKFPKQFHDVLGIGKTLLQMTFERLNVLVPSKNIYIVTNEMYKNQVLEQLTKVTEGQVLLEPMMRNTAPCIAYAAFKIHALNKNARLIVAPSDHLITNENLFIQNIETALVTAEKEQSLITLGIKPSRPDTGYGYIQFSESKTAENKDIKKVKTFTEKPNAEIAQEFINSGDFLWNSGIFIWTSKAIIKAFETSLPETYELFDEGNEYYNTLEEDKYIQKIYPTCPKESIDYGIMEKANNVFVLPVNFGWSDLGTWGSLYTHINHDSENNACVNKNTTFYNSSNNIVKVSKDKIAVIQGLDDYIIVDEEKSLLICKKEDEQKIKYFVQDVRREKGEEFV
ncbi:MAG: mannose-1-phosphate guanylyltransferase [Ichthyobacteriaceae bacterium]|nr:mannose-1-phosphate guanylyltransferase [Ichthyobacteriaceae bacterium]